MFLKRIAIQGFKSFATATTVDFSVVARRTQQTQYGITAIVGPNGSGKSNIADAMRWVMGEQSMKSLRSKKSEDVIFAGSARQRRMNAASVTLFFDNSDHRLPVEYDEVAVGRTVYRDGTGEYTINGSKVRLLDVVDILAHCGVGKGSYTIVTQGMTDSLLSATPLERRIIIEDAAGVKPFQIKKQRALVKLASTRTNLERVAGLIAEIEPHLKMLKRQADRAAKAEDIAVLLREKQQILYSYRWRVFRAEQETIIAERDAHAAQMHALQREVDAMTDVLQKEVRTMEERATQGDAALLAEKRDIGERLQDARKHIAMIDGRCAVEREQMAREIAGLKSRVPVDATYVRDHLDHVAHALDTAFALDNLPALHTAVAAIRTSVRDLRGDVIRGSVDVDIRAARDAIVCVTEERIATLLQERALHDATRVREEAALETVDRALHDAARADRAARLAFFEKERSLREQERTLTALRDAWNDAKIRLARVEVREEDLIATIHGALHMTPDALCAMVPEISVDDETALDAMVRRLTIQHEAIGTIDPLVIQEYQETQERYDFLTKEHADLTKASADLVVVIKEMEQEIDAAFRKAYNFINQEFQKYFRMMFGGGTARLHKVDVAVPRVDDHDADVQSDDESDAHPDMDMRQGITITATPPGKNIEDLALLSGGERSLVSLALLFAVIAFNPPPFVVLDEVEAALDESNARRFGNIVEELSQRTQFVIITHNRETMRHAAVLYGVTMNNDGISRLLSVTLDRVAAPDTESKSVSV